MNIGNIELKPFSKFDKDWALVASGDDFSSNMMTVSWGGVGTLWSKPVAFIFIRESRYTKAFIDKSEYFSVSFLDKKYKDALTLCGTKSGRDLNKWSATGLTPVYANNTVYPKESSQVFVCRKIASCRIDDNSILDKSIISEFYKDSDMHTMYIGEIVESI